MGLRRYQKMRDFESTPEPKGFLKQGKGHSFVIQKHAARRLHYDFRLEMDGVLKSWAVPKGLPTQRGERRLAMHVEDHPLSYADFEGIIPPGNYGAGSVMVWDYGTFAANGKGGPAGLNKGHIDFTLQGKKLKGDWTLVRMRQGENGKDPWLVIKRGKDMKAIGPRQDDRSALTGRTMKQIAEQKKRVWQSNRGSGGKPKASRAADSKPAEPKPAPIPDSKLPAAKPAFVDPMKALLVEKVPAGHWELELKFDGIRALILKRGKKVQVLSRNRKDYSQRFSDLAKAVAELPVKTAVLDGEVVALDEKGRSSFQLLQQPLLEGIEIPLYFYAFDLLQLEGRDLKSLPLRQRKQLLESLLAGSGDPLRFSANLKGKAEVLLKKIRSLGLEGLIAKRADSVYESGRRSGAWLKIKVTQQQEFVVGGFTEPRRSRPHFGALIVGYYDGKELKFASKVGTGFDHQLLKELHQRMKAMIQAKVPFSDLPQKGPHGIPPYEMKRCTWIEPKLVAEIRFSEWTRDGHLRQPVFLGIRPDLDPKEVRRERAATGARAKRRKI
ncbi:MAG TPA: non-homologous end-joining DNA ligase [bacterium]|nr:non-homologous end-joining DNA ligase [bacterium]